MTDTDTRIYKEKDLDRPSVQKDIKDTIQSGRNIIFPTETVYGIGAYALSEEGVWNIYRIKGRPSDNPLIMHIGDTDMLDDYVHVDQPYVKTLMETFWPGPLTLVMRRKDSVPDTITGGLDTVGVRLPSHPVALKVLSIADVPICAPSANISGEPSSTLFEHVYKDFNGLVDIIVDGGKSDVGIESTVLDVTQATPVILRPGVITRSMIESVTGHADMSSALEEDKVPQAPGMKYKHYAPSGELTIVDGEDDRVVKYINDKIKVHQASGKTVGVIATEDLVKTFDTPYVYNIGPRDDDAEIASNLYTALRHMDQLGITHIYSVAFRESKYQEAIMNRLLKAANNNLIKV